MNFLINKRRSIRERTESSEKSSRQECTSEQLRAADMVHPELRELEEKRRGPYPSGHRLRASGEEIRELVGVSVSKAWNVDIQRSKKLLTRRRLLYQSPSPPARVHGLLLYESCKPTMRHAMASLKNVAPYVN